MQKVVILLPGIMGSELWLNGELIWPGPAHTLLFPYKKMAALKDPACVATNVIRRFSFSEQYQGLIDDLASCDFREVNQTLFVCPYDWRKSILLAAQVLADKIDEAFAAHGGQAEISLVAHSMGGIVSRCYLESGDFDQRPGFAAVRRLLTLGTPHRGAPISLTAAMGLEKRLFLSAAQVKELVNDARYPGLYELLPPVGEPFVWDSTPNKGFAEMNIYDSQISGTLGLNPTSLAAAQQFQTKLSVQRRPQHVRYFFFTGSSQKTLATVNLRQVGAAYRTERIERENGGDGTVPIWSGGVTGIQGQAVGGEHGTIYRDKDLRRTLGILLEKPGILKAAPGAVQVTVRDRVAEPDAPLIVTLAFPTPVRDLKGELRLERVTFDTSGAEVSAQVFGNPLQVVFAGPELEQLIIKTTTPNVIGTYRVTYYHAGNLAPAGSDELFVQQPDR